MLSVILSALHNTSQSLSSELALNPLQNQTNIEFKDSSNMTIGNTIQYENTLKNAMQKYSDDPAKSLQKYESNLKTTKTNRQINKAANRLPVNKILEKSENSNVNLNNIKENKHFGYLEEPVEGYGDDDRKGCHRFPGSCRPISPERQMPWPISKNHGISEDRGGNFDQKFASLNKEKDEILGRIKRLTKEKESLVVDQQEILNQDNNQVIDSTENLYKIQAINAEIHNLEETLKQNKETQKTLESMLNYAKGQAIELSIDVHNQDDQNTTQSTEKRKTEISNQLKELNNQLEQLGQERQQLEQEKTSFNSQIAQESQSLNNVRQSYDVNTHSCYGANANPSVRLLACSTLSNSGERIVEHESKIAQLNKDLNVIYNKLNDNNERISNIERQRQELQGKYDTIRSSRTIVENRSFQDTPRAEVLVDSMAVVGERLPNFKSDLVRQREELKGQIKELREQAQEYGTIENLRQEKEEKLTSLRNLRKEKDLIRNQFNCDEADPGSTIGQLCQSSDQGIEATENRISEIDRKIGQLESINERIHGVEQQLEPINEEILRLKQQPQELQNEYNDLINSSDNIYDALNLITQSNVNNGINDSVSTIPPSTSLENAITSVIEFVHNKFSAGLKVFGL